MSTDDIYLGCERLQLNINPVQATELYRKLDYNKDGYVDFQDWIEVIREETNPYLARVRENIKKYRMTTENVLKSMGLSRDQKSVNILLLKESLL